MKRVIVGILGLLLATAACGGYTPLSYLEATGHQWIYTGYTPNATDRVETKVRFSSLSGYPFVYCARGASGKNSFSCVSVGSRFRMDHGESAQTSFATNLVTGLDYAIVADGATGKCTFNNLAWVGAMSTAAYTPAGPFALLASHNDGAGLSPSSAVTGFVSGRLYYFRVYNQAGELVRDYIPVRDDDAAEGSTLRYGMFEAVTGVYYPNCGTYAFTPGPEAGPEPRRVQRSIKIDEVATANGTMQVSLAFANPGFAQRFFLAWGDADVGATTNGWDHVDALADIGAWEMSRMVTIPAGASYVRFFAQPKIPGAKMVASLSSTGVNEYVDTGFQPDSNSSAELGFYMPAKPAGYVSPFGSRNGGNSQFLVIASADGRWLFRHGNQAIDNATIGAPPMVGEHTFKIERNQHVSDGVVRNLRLSEYTKQYNVFVFAHNNNNAPSMFCKMDFRSLALWDDGALSRAYVPCVKDDGTPAIYDSVTGRFDANQGSTPLTVGAEVWSITESQAVNLTIPVRAEWTGNGNVENFADSANWICWNVRDEVLENAIPNEITEIVVKGTTAFNWPAGRSLVCKSIAFDCTLSVDRDWRGLDASKVAPGAKINLAGHKLYIADLAFDGVITGQEDLTKPIPGNAWSSSTFSYTEVANVFNDNFTWVGDGNCRVLVAQANLPMEVVYDFGEGSETVVNCYRLFGNGNGLKERMPKSWTLQGSNDKQNWTLLDTRPEETGWSLEDISRTYSFANNTPYRFYRMELTSTQSPEAAYLEFTQLEFFEGPVTVSELHVEVPEGATTVGTAVLKGSLKLIKEGAGTLMPTVARQYYTGGTVIASGTVASGVNGNFAYGWGRIEILEGGTFDTNGQINSNGLTFILDGGILANSGSAQSVTLSVVGSLVLKSDSYLDPQNAYGGWMGDGCYVIDLGGHVLEALAGDTVQIKGAGTITNGTMVVKSGFTTYNAQINADTVDFEFHQRIILYQSIMVHDVILQEDSYPNGSTAGAIRVGGVFTSYTTNFPKVQFRDGSTFNLTTTTGAWPTTSDTAGVKMSFAEGATVTLDLGTRPLRSGMKALEWEEGDAPENVDTVRFLVKDRNYRAQVGEDGLYLFNTSTVIIIR